MRVGEDSSETVLAPVPISSRAFLDDRRGREDR